MRTWYGVLIGFTLAAAIERIGQSDFVYPAAICVLATINLILTIIVESQASHRDT